MNLSPNTITMLLALLAGLAVTLLALLVAGRVAAIPPENREYKDQPPLGFRLLWWPIHWVSYTLTPFISRAPTSALNTRLRKAGLGYALTSSQFLGGTVVSAAVAAGITFWVLRSLSAGTGADLSAATLLKAALVGGLAGFGYPWLWLRDRIALNKRQLLKALPFYLDLITLCVEAGLNLQGAFNQAVDKGPRGVLRDELQRVLRDIRNGKARAEAMQTMSERLQEPSITNFVNAMVQAERIGMNLGTVLRAQADQRRSERFLRAEKLAMEAPVKLLFPLIAFIFPCTFIVLGFPLVYQFLNAGF